MKKTTQLRKKLQEHQLLVAPGIFDGLSARLVEQAGFEAIYASGGAIARSAGYPDLGLLNINEICQRLAQITEVTTQPVIADADTGYGNALNVHRSVKMFERAGVAGIHLEDQQEPKRCGHLDDKKLVPTQEMVQKLLAAIEARQDPDFLIIARTDAIAAEGFSAAIDRARAYLNAGADMIFVEAPESLEQIEQIAKEIPEPKLINMFYGGKTPLVPIDTLKKLGYQLMIIPSDLQRAAIYAMQQTLQAILKEGDSHRLADSITTFKQREQIIDTASYLALDAKLAGKVQLKSR